MRGFVDTRHGPGTRGWGLLNDADRKAILDHTRLGRTGTPDDVVKAVMFVLRDAPFMTGAVLRLDGGYVLIGLAAPQPAVFADVDWGSGRVLAQTRERLAQGGLRWTELDALWDVDRPEDLDHPLARELLAPADGPDAGGAPQ